MSNFNNSDLFLEPKTTQHGSHMIMSNVNRPKKNKFINIDTRFRDEYNYLQNANYNITLPERITEVKTMKLTNIEIPMSFYNISANLGNNCFKVTTGGNSSMVIIPDGNYTATTLSTAINNAISALGSPYSNLKYEYSSDLSGGSVLYSSSGSITVEFAVTSTGQPDKYNVKSKLGWLLGFRNIIYTVTVTHTVSESFVDLNGSRYLYLAIDEFNKGNQNSFVSPLATSLINKNIIGRISMDTNQFGYGTILPANRYNGFLISDCRSYTGKIDLLKLNVQLLNENGINMAMNGMDFSFCLEVEHE
jgi:hypothetical protein